MILNWNLLSIVKKLKKIKQNRRKWVPICTYNNKDDAINKIKNDDIWSKTHRDINSEGKWVYYRCNQVKRHGKQCPILRVRERGCKHIIVRSIRLKYRKLPLEAKNAEIGTKRKRGRLSKAKQALLTQ
jgi:hypothetical protein